MPLLHSPLTTGPSPGVGRVPWLPVSTAFRDGAGRLLFCHLPAGKIGDNFFFEVQEQSLKLQVGKCECKSGKNKHFLPNLGAVPLQVCYLP